MVLSQEWFGCLSLDDRLWDNLERLEIWHFTKIRPARMWSGVRRNPLLCLQVISKVERHWRAVQWWDMVQCTASCSSTLYKGRIPWVRMNLNILLFVAYDHSAEPLIFPLEYGSAWRVKVHSYQWTYRFGPLPLVYQDLATHLVLHFKLKWKNKLNKSFISADFYKSGWGMKGKLHFIK